MSTDKLGILQVSHEPEEVKQRVNGEFVPGLYYTVLDGRGERLWAPKSAFYTGNLKLIQVEKINVDDDKAVEILALEWIKEMAVDNGARVTDDYIRRNIVQARNRARRMMRILNRM